MSQSGPLKVRAMPSGNGFPRLKKNLFVVGVSSGYFLVCIAIACLASGVGGCCGVRCAADSWILQEHISVQRAVPFLSAEVFRSFSVSKTVDEKHGGCWRGRLVLRGGAWDGESDDEHVISLTGGSRPARQETERRAAPSRERNVGGDVRGGRDGDGGRAAMKEVGDQCVSIIQSMGGVADLNRIVARWRQLSPRDFLTRDGACVFRGKAAISFEEALLATGRVSTTTEPSRPDVKVFSIAASPTMGGSPANLGLGTGSMGGGGGMHAQGSHQVQHGQQFVHQSGQYPQQQNAQFQQQNAQFQQQNAQFPQQNAQFLPLNAHGKQLLPKYLVLHKTRMCRDWVQTGKCQFEGHCSFAHGKHELRSPAQVATADQFIPPIDPRAMAQQRSMNMNMNMNSNMHMQQPQNAMQTPMQTPMQNQGFANVPVPFDYGAENFTFSGRVMRVMASENYPAEAHFCIAESALGNPDIFVSRKAVGDDLWKELHEWWLQTKGVTGKPFSVSLICQAFKKGSNNYRAIQVEGKVETPESSMPEALAPNVSVDDAAAATDNDAEAALYPGMGMMRGKPLGGDFQAKLGYQCVITSSGKNFSFADDCIYIRNELRDAHGVKGLWVGDIVSVDAAYNQHKGNWVATQVTLVKRNNSGYISMQDAIEKIAQQRVDQMRQFQTDSPSQQQAWSDASVLDEAQAVAEAAATGLQQPLANGNLSAVLQDPVMLQSLIAALQQQQQQQHQSDGDSPRPPIDVNTIEPWKAYYKTEMCSNLLKTGRCRYGSKCTFAHSKEELRNADGTLQVPPAPPEHAKRVDRPTDADSDSERSGRKRPRADLSDTGKTLSQFTEAEICAGELFVGGLQRRRYSNEQLRNAFAKYGEVKDCRIIMDMTRSPPVSRGYGFVSFADPRDNLKAVQGLDGKRLSGRILRVTPAETSRGEEEAALQQAEDENEEELLADDYVDPKEQTIAPQIPESGAYGEDQFVCQNGQEGPMHVAMMQGLPNYMEDNWGALIGDQTAAPPPVGDVHHKDSFSMFGVFDGHNGYRGSLFAREMLLRNMKDLMTSHPSVEDILRTTHEGYLKTDDDFLAMGMGDGACLVTICVTPTHIIAANAGDSRAVLGVNGMSIELTQDHKPGRPDEQQRIEDLGGFVIELGVPRVMGYLAVSRALGDAKLKKFVIADPGTHVVERSKEQRFVVLATDGLWDVMSSDEAVQFVYQHWHLPDHGAEFLVKEALGRFSNDNICAMIVDVQTNLTSSARASDITPAPEDVDAAEDIAATEPEIGRSSVEIAEGNSTARVESGEEDPGKQRKSRKLVKDGGKDEGEAEVKRKRKEKAEKAEKTQPAEKTGTRGRKRKEKTGNETAASGKEDDAGASDGASSHAVGSKAAAGAASDDGAGKAAAGREDKEERAKGGEDGKVAEEEGEKGASKSDGGA